jgi:hypothetical protein
MGVNLTQGLLLDKAAEVLYEFLPGTPHPYADPRLSFPGVATEMGLSAHWRGGSKRPALRHLLEVAFSLPGKFCPLILIIVQRGITKRKKANPVSREEIEQLNQLLLKLAYKIPDLWDSEFLNALPRTSKAASSDAKNQLIVPWNELFQEFTALQSLKPHPRGFAFERFLNRLFAIFQLAPRESFRNTGEQIDGSFRLAGEYYLVEARWQDPPVANDALLTFSGKVARKSEWSRGAFFSWSGFSREGLLAFSGMPTNIICVDGLDVFHLLQGKIDLAAVLEAKVRRAAESGKPYVPVRDLFFNGNLIQSARR